MNLSQSGKSEQFCTDGRRGILYTKDLFNHLCMRCSAAFSLGLLCGLPGFAQQPAEERAPELDQHTIKSNIEYRLTRGDLPQLSFGVEKPKNVEVIGGGEEL